jgi:hypothetical protein
MKLFFWLLILFNSAFALNCDLPCGVSQLIECAANTAGVTSEDFFNQKLFAASNIDGFCKSQDSTQIKTNPQKIFFDRFCLKSNINSFTYTNFIKAASHFPTFGCAGDRDNRYKELAGFLTTISQETSSRLYNYTNDGLYFRYENSALKWSSLNHKTNYFPNNNFIVAMDDEGDIYSEAFWYGTKNAAQVYDLTTSPENLTWGNITIPEGFKATPLNKIVLPGYWIGMGPIQLTGPSLIEFLGWYNNLVIDNQANKYNLDEFIARYVSDGEMAFSGAFWYWMVRVSGAKYRTLHQMVTDSKRIVCHDIGAVTPVINGGCRGYNPGRVNYYKYYSNLFHIDIKPVKTDSLNSMECSKAIKLYCQK